ncbi:MAG: ABC transporter substrate-binding protein [Xanthobacteraceae bacterium]|nr:ABC transporter substrate-binding protein [Xanthobacteraceae bacterium]
MVVTRRAFIGGVMLAASAAAYPVHAAESIKVMVFPGISNLPLFAAQSQGLFQKRGLTVEVLNTPNSEELRLGLAQGRHQIAHAGVDNAVALAETGKADVAVVVGGHGGFGRLFVQADVQSLAALRGRTVVVDAPNTAYALVLYKMLQDNGLRRGDYTVNPAGGTASMLAALLKDKANAAAIISPPFAFRAEREGLKDLGPVKDAIGAYQFDAGFVMRPWARANADTLVRYVQAYVEGCRWALDPVNRAAAIGLLSGRLKLSPSDAERTYRLIVDPRNGIERDARLDLDGFRNTLKLRAEIEGQWGGTPPPAERYVDESYYRRALAELDR